MAAASLEQQQQLQQLRVSLEEKDEQLGRLTENMADLEARVNAIEQ